MILKYKKKSTAKQMCLQKQETQELQLKESFGIAQFNCAWGLCPQIQQQVL